MKASFDTLRAQLPAPAGSRADYPHGLPFAQAMRHGSMSMELFVPALSQLGRDVQQPHRQDELYIVLLGTAELVRGTERSAAQAGDAFFVPAGQAHRFENFSDDFSTWVVFYGLDGGEHP